MGLNRRQRYERDLAMAHAAAAGNCYREIARAHGVSEKTVQRAVHRVRSRQASTLPVLERTAEHVLRLDRSIEDLALARAAGPTPRSMIAAIQCQATLLMERHRLAACLWPKSVASGRNPEVPCLANVRDRLLTAARSDGLGPGVEKWLEGQLAHYDAFDGEADTCRHEKCPVDRHGAGSQMSASASAIRSARSPLERSHRTDHRAPR